MFLDMQKLFKKHRELILYGVFGVLTTIVNYVVALFANFVLLQNHVQASWPSVSIAWVVSVIFAYITNRIWVFRSEETQKTAVLKEITAFFGARLFSGFLEVALMTLFVDKMGYDFDIMKLLSNVVVVILNYIFSKLFIFKSKGNSKAQKYKQAD